MHYNVSRQHKSLGGVSPSMAAKVTDRPWDMEWIVGLIDARAPAPNRPKTYRKRGIANRISGRHIGRQVRVAELVYPRSSEPIRVEAIKP